MSLLPDLSGVAGRVVWLLVATNFGVPLFFVLSGFLITRQLAAHMPVRTFYRHRFAKIYPMFLLAVLVFGWVGGLTEPSIWWRHLLALHNGAASVSSQVSGHLWSLAVEIQFYLLAPWLFALGYRWLSARSMALVAAAVWAGHAAWLLAVPPVQHERLAALLDVYQFTSFNMLALLLGALLYRTCASGVLWRGVGVWTVLAALSMPLICAVVVPSLRVDHVDLTRDTSMLALLALIALPPVASMGLAYLTLKRQWFSGRRWRAGAAWVAAISYQWYLWHPLVLLGMQRAGQRWPAWGEWVQAWPWVALLFYGLVSALLGWLAYRGLERPLHRWLLGRSSAPQ